MKRLSLVVALLFALTVPAVASAKGGAGHKAAAKHCKVLRAEVGGAVFRDSYGGKSGKRAMKRCIAAQKQASKAAKRRARKSCRAEGRKRGRALKRCLRDKLTAEPAASPESFKEAVDECQAYREEDPEGFAEEYGDGAEAFEQCVAEYVSDEESGDDGDATEDDDTVDEDPGDAEPDAEPDPV